MSNNELILNTDSFLNLNENLVNINLLVDSLIEFSIKDLKSNDMFTYEKFSKDFSLNNLICNKYSNYNISNKIPGLLLHKKDSSSFFLFDEKDRKLINEILSHKINSIFIYINIRYLFEYSTTIIGDYSKFYLDSINLYIKGIVIEKIINYLSLKRENNLLFNKVYIFKPESNFCGQILKESFKINETIIKDIFMSNMFFDNFIFIEHQLNINDFKQYVSEDFLIELGTYINKQTNDFLDKQKEKESFDKQKKEELKEYQIKKDLEKKEKNKAEEKIALLVFLGFLFLASIIFFFR